MSGSGTGTPALPSATLYLQPSDYAAYGVPASTTVNQVAQACMLVDAYCKRPEGLIYVPDASGNPTYMARKPPGAQFSIVGGLAPGDNVVATVNGPTKMLGHGAVLICDRANPSIMEPLNVVKAVGNQVTFLKVTQTHAANVVLEDGLVIFETKQMPNNRPLAIMQKNPVRTLLKGQGRYGYNRRGSSANYSLNEFNLLAVMTQFGGPPIWQEINMDITEFNPQTGECWIPAGIMLAYYTEIRMYYLAGFLANELPDAIKFATATLINTQTNVPLQGNLKSMKAGDTSLERFLDTVFDADTRNQLNPYRARPYV